jgi:hypothetical protein
MPAKPPNRQLNCLRALASRAGQTFTYPTTSAEASAEIKRLKSTTPSSRVEVRIERKQIAHQIADGPNDAARFRHTEITGYGPSATWTENRDQEPAPTSDTATPALRNQR